MLVSQNTHSLSLSQISTGFAQTVVLKPALLASTVKSSGPAPNPQNQNPLFETSAPD